MSKRDLLNYQREVTKKSYDLRKSINQMDSEKDYERVQELREKQTIEYNKSKFLANLLTAISKVDKEKSN